MTISLPRIGIYLRTGRELGLTLTFGEPDDIGHVGLSFGDASVLLESLKDKAPLAIKGDDGWILTVEPNRTDFALVVNDDRDPAKQRWIAGMQFLCASRLAMLAVELEAVMGTVGRLNEENNACDRGVDFIEDGASPAH